MRRRHHVSLLATALAGFLTLAACGGPSDDTAVREVLSDPSLSSDRSGAVVGGLSTTCPAQLDVLPGDFGICRLRAGDSTEATVIIPLQAASEAWKTRIIFLCDYTKVRTVTTFRRESNLPWETITRDFTNDPQCSTGKALQLRYDPENDYPYAYNTTVVAARNRDVKIRIPSCDEAYGWLCPFYNNPSILVQVADYDPANVTPTIPGV
ncbi:MAG: hypothetical protein ACO3C1_13660 [Ilumatobacteraceae bacterium]